MKFHTDLVQSFPIKIEERIIILFIIDLQMYKMSYNLSTVFNFKQNCFIIVIFIHFAI